MLQASQASITRNGRIAQANTNAIPVVARRYVRPRMNRKNPGCASIVGHRVATAPATSRHDELDHSPFMTPADLVDLVLQQPVVGRRNGETLTAFREPVKVIIEEADPSFGQRHSFKQTVAEMQTAVTCVYGVGRCAVDQPHGSFPMSSALIMPFAFERVSASSFSGSESATMPPPARRLSTSPSRTMVLIRIFRSRLPSRFR